MNQIEHYAGNQELVRRDRGQNLATRKVYNQVKLAALKADGAMALAAHMMEKAVELDSYRRLLAQDDVAVNMMLSEIEVFALRKCQSLQQNLYSAWDF